MLMLMLICCERKTLLNGWLISSSEHGIIRYMNMILADLLREKNTAKWV
jgi:hypothetical protein